MRLVGVVCGSRVFHSSLLLLVAANVARFQVLVAEFRVGTGALAPGAAARGDVLSNGLATRLPPLGRIRLHCLDLICWNGCMRVLLYMLL